MEIVLEKFYLGSFNKSQVGSSVYRQGWNKYSFYTRTNKFFYNIGEVVWNVVA